MNKIIKTEISITILLLVALIIGGSFYLQNKKEVQPNALLVQNIQSVAQQTMGAQQTSTENQNLTQYTSMDYNFYHSRDNDPNKNDATVGDATINKGWHKYTAKDNSFTLEFPSNWKNEGGMFFDDNDKKIAGLMPGIIALEPNELNKKCFYNVDPTRIISDTNVIINNYKGAVLIEKIIPTGEGVWFSSSYCVKNKNKTFIMAFYDKELNSTKKELFDMVISSLQFK